MSGDRHVRALLLHVLGWVALLATALVARSDAIGTGWPSWAGLAVGTSLFVGLTVRSGIDILDSIRAADRASARLGCRAHPPSAPTWPTRHNRPDGIRPPGATPRRRSRRAVARHGAERPDGARPPGAP